jgi:hypothetical protein
MKEETSNSNDPKLSALLRESRVPPSLPPHFDESVWRRIENSEAAPVRARQNWIEILARLALRPRFAFAVALVLISAGSIFGVRQGQQAARHDMQTRYVYSVAPDSLR